MSRITSNLDLPLIQVQPQARPTDQGIVPAIRPPEQGNRFLEFASTLAQLNPKLQQVANTAIELDNKHASNQAQQDIAQHQIKNQEQFNKLVGEGKIHPSNNPWYSYAKDESISRIEAGDAIAQLEVDYASSDIRNTDDLSQVSKFAGDHFEQFTKNRTPAQMQIMQPAFQNATNRLLSQHAAYRAEAKQEETQSLLPVELSEMFKTSGEDPNKFGVTINQWVNDKHAKGVPFSSINKSIEKFAYETALARDNPSAYSSILSTVRVAGAKSTLADTMSNQARQVDLLNDWEGRHGQQDSRAQKEADQAAINAAVVPFITKASQGPIDDKDVFAAAAQLPPTIRQTFLSKVVEVNADAEKLRNTKDAETKKTLTRKLTGVVDANGKVDSAAAAAIFMEATNTGDLSATENLGQVVSNWSHLLKPIETREKPEPAVVSSVRTSIAKSQSDGSLDYNTINNALAKNVITGEEYRGYAEQIEGLKKTGGNLTPDGLYGQAGVVTNVLSTVEPQLTQGYLAQTGHTYEALSDEHSSVKANIDRQKLAVDSAVRQATQKYLADNPKASAVQLEEVARKVADQKITSFGGLAFDKFNQAITLPPEPEAKAEPPKPTPAEEEQARKDQQLEGKISGPAFKVFQNLQDFKKVDEAMSSIDKAFVPSAVSLPLFKQSIPSIEQAEKLSNLAGYDYIHLWSKNAKDLQGGFHDLTMFENGSPESVAASSYLASHADVYAKQSPDLHGNALMQTVFQDWAEDRRQDLAAELEKRGPKLAEHAKYLTDLLKQTNGNLSNLLPTEKKAAIARWHYIQQAIDGHEYIGLSPNQVQGVVQEAFKSGGERAAYAAARHLYSSETISSSPRAILAMEPVLDQQFQSFGLKFSPEVFRELGLLQQTRLKYLTSKFN